MRREDSAKSADFILSASKRGFSGMVHSCAVFVHLLFAASASQSLNPDIAMGKKFYVAAKQFDGTQRCYFIQVGSRIEQGAVMHAKGTHAECKTAYKMEIALGSYDSTTDSSIQKYRKGDSKFCGSRQDADQRGLVQGKEKRVGRKIKRRSSLTMIKKENQVGITAFVREPRRCEYEVVLHGPEILLLGGGANGSSRKKNSGKRKRNTKERRLDQDAAAMMRRRRSKSRRRRSRSRRRRLLGREGEKSSNFGSTSKRKRKHHEDL